LSTPEGYGNQQLEPERREGFGRREEDNRPAGTADHVDGVRSLAATLFAFCGGLAILYLFVAAIGAVDLGDALVATIVAVVLAVVWLIGAFQRYRTGSGFFTRRERERRGF